MGNRQTRAAKPQTEVTQTAQKFEPEPEPSTVKTEVPVAIPETPPQPSEPPFEPPPDDTSPIKDTTQDPPPPPLEDSPVEVAEIKEQKEPEKELLEPLPVLLNESESVEEKLRQSEDVVHVMESVTEQNELISVTIPVTDQEVIVEDPIPITSEDTTKNETNEIKENEIESKIEDKSPEAVLLESEIAVCKEEEEELKEEVKNEEEDEEEEEIADSKTPSIAMETASVSSSAIKMDVEYMKGIMGTSLTFPDATSNESVIGSLAVSEQMLDESLWDNSGPSKSSTKCPIPCKEDSVVSIDFQMTDQTIKVGLTTLEPVQKEDQKKQEIIPEECEIPEVKEVQSKSVLDPLDEEIPVAPELSHSTSTLEKFESFVSVEFREENEEIKVGMNCVSKAQIASSTSMVSDKQMSVELNTPFVDVDEEDPNLRESKSGDTLSDSKSSEKTKVKKTKKSTSTKSTGSGVEGDLESTNVQVKRANSGQRRGSRGRGRGRGRKN